MKLFTMEECEWCVLVGGGMGDGSMRVKDGGFHVSWKGTGD